MVVKNVSQWECSFCAKAGAWRRRQAARLSLIFAGFPPGAAAFWMSTPFFGA
jgi:hypothetical protein